MELSDLKAAYRIPAAWRDLGLPGQPGKCVPSPLRQDRSPSFSVFEDGLRWKDFGTGEGGDVFDFVAKALVCTLADAIKWVKNRLGITASPKRNPTAKTAGKLPPLRRGTPTEHRALMEKRGFSLEALTLAEQRGVLHFTKLWNFPAWAVTDRRRALVEFRRLDGCLWPAFGRLAARKSHAYGSKRWPLGVLEARPFNHVIWTEGAPDMIAGHHFVVAEGKQDRVAVVTVLGASNTRLDPDALIHLAGKDLLMFPHADAAGQGAARAWAEQLKKAGVRTVAAFDLSGLVMSNGNAGKDLCDLLKVDPDCWECTTKFRGGILP